MSDEFRQHIIDTANPYVGPDALVQAWWMAERVLDVLASDPKVRARLDSQIRDRESGTAAEAVQATLRRDEE